MKRILLLAICFTGLQLSENLPAQHPMLHYVDDPARSPREHEVDFQRLIVDVHFEPEIKKVKGRVTHHFAPIRNRVDSLWLDGPGINCKSASLQGKPVKMDKRPDGWMFYFSESLTYGTVYELTIDYEAIPAKGLYFIGWDDPSGRCRKQIWTQGQAVDNRYWLPMFDSQNDKVISEMIITFPAPYFVLSNGILKEKKELPDGQIRWHYAMEKPHSTYLMMLGIGEYAIEQRKTASGVTMNLLYYPDHKDRVEPTYRYSVEMFDFFEKEIGYPYAWGVYSQIPVQDFMFGAMENTTATLFGDFFCVDERGFNDRNYVGVNAHELAHQWFGDLVTARSLTHHWLQESFATYYNMLYEREAFGQDYFDWSRRTSALRAYGASEKDLLPIADSRAGSPRFYPKGALVLHMLRHFTGREVYNRAILHYLKEHEFQNVDSHDLLNAFAESAGISLNWFWDQWVLKGGEPEFEISTQVVNVGNKRFLEFMVNQVHEINEYTSVFAMKVTCSAYDAAGTRVSGDFFIREKQERILLPLPQGFEPAFGLFDEACTHLRKARYTNRKTAQWMAQAKLANNILDRYDAVVALASTPWKEKLSLYQQLLASNVYYPVKGEIVRQAMKLAKTEPTAHALVLQALNDKDQQTRKEALKYITRPDRAMADAIVSNFSLKDGSYDLLAKSLELLALVKDHRLDSLREITAHLRGNRGESYRIIWLEVAVQNNLPDHELALRELVDRCGPAWDFLTRVAAWQALYRLGYLDAEMLDVLPHILTHANTRLSGPVRQVIRDFAQIHKHARIILDWANDDPIKAAPVVNAIGW